MKKILWSYRIFVLIFIFTSYIFYFASIDTVMNGDILYWIEDVKKEEVVQSIESFSTKPIVFKKVSNGYHAHVIEFFSKNSFAPDSFFAFEASICNNTVYGSILFNQCNTKALLALKSYKNEDSEWEHFLWSRNFEKPLTVAKQFEENVLCNFPKIRTSRWRTIRGITSVQLKF